MSEQWYYAKGGQRQGPVAVEALKELAATGQLQQADLVWQSGMSQWTEARNVGEIWPVAQTVAGGPPRLPIEATAGAEYPKEVGIAAVMWIVSGSIFLLILLRDATTVGNAGEALAFLLMALADAAVILAGVQSWRGTAKDTLVIGIFSVIIGLLLAGVALAPPHAVGLVIVGLALLTAGALALAGRKKYKAWRGVPINSKKSSVSLSPQMSEALRRKIDGLRQSLIQQVLTQHDKFSDIEPIATFRQEHAHLEEQLGQLQCRLQDLEKANAEYEVLDSACHEKSKDLAASEVHLRQFDRQLGHAAFEGFLVGQVKILPIFNERLAVHKRIGELQAEHDRLQPPTDAGMMQKAKAKAQQTIVAGKSKLSQMGIGKLEEQIGRHLIAANEEDLVRCDQTAETSAGLEAQRSTIALRRQECGDAQQALDSRKQQLAQALQMASIEGSKSFDTERQGCHVQLAQIDSQRSALERQLPDQLLAGESVEGDGELGLLLRDLRNAKTEWEAPRLSGAPSSANGPAIPPLPPSFSQPPSAKAGLDRFVPDKWMQVASRPAVAIGISVGLVLLVLLLAIAFKESKGAARGLFGLLVFASAMLIYYDASSNKIGKIPPRKLFSANMSAGGWAGLTIGFWLYGLPLYLIKRPQLIQKAQLSPQKPNRLLFFGLTLGPIALLILLAVVVGLKDATLTDSKLVSVVKQGKLEACPNATVEKMVNSFMGSPSWDSGVSKDGVSFVNVSGAVTFQDTPVRATIQFEVDEKKGTFQYRSLEFNGVPQINLIGLGLLNKMCESTH